MLWVIPAAENAAKREAVLSVPKELRTVVPVCPEGRSAHMARAPLALLGLLTLLGRRRCVLFSALAAEAFINSFIAVTLPKRDRERIDRKRTVDKYALGPKLAVDEDLSDLEKREELTVLERLFTIRNRLVHPKPRQLEEIARVGASRWRWGSCLRSCCRASCVLPLPL
jgi:hypothetical protein